MHNPPTTIEMRILAGCARGRGLQQIARDLDLSLNTVKRHLKHLATQFETTGDQGALVDHGYRTGLLTGLRPEPRDTIRLTERHRQVLPAVSRGETYAQIARGLGISETTAKRQVASLCRVLGARSRSHAVALAHQQHLLTTTARAAA